MDCAPATEITPNLRPHYDGHFMNDYPKPIRIGIFIRNLDGGGAERVAVNLANALSEQYFVTLYLLDSQGPYRDQVDKKVKVKEIGQKRLLFSFLELSRHLRRDRIDAVISNMTHENIVAGLAKLFYNFRLLAVEHNNFHNELKDRGHKVYYMTRFLYRIVHRLFNAIVTVSDGVRQELALAYPSARVLRIYNPIINDTIRTQLSSSTLHQAMPSMYLIFVGRLTAQKNPVFLVDTFSILVNKYGYKGDLVILGIGPLLADVEEHVRKVSLQHRVHFMGFSKNPYPLMKNADALVLTSRWEGFGNVLIEAMYAGTRVISSNCPYGPSEIINDPDLGTLVNSYEDAEVFALAIHDGLKKEKKTEKLKMRANDFTVSSVMKDYECLLET